MPILKSVSGIRGTVGGKPGDNLTAIDLVSYVSAYAMWMRHSDKSGPIIIGRDGRLSGHWISQLAASTLVSMGLDVIDLDYSTTPTVEMYVLHSQASGGIILTASHNPAQWNALKLLNHRGEFLNQEDNDQLQSIVNQQSYEFATVDTLGSYKTASDAIGIHVEQILSKDYIPVDDIVACKYRVLVDCINSTGAIALPPLLESLGCTYDLINADNFGTFAHDPEPLTKNLAATMDAAKNGDYDLTIVVDPDVDRLLLIDENGNMVGEEYTLIIAADYYLNHTKGPVVNNLSSSRGLYDVAQKHKVPCASAKVGEAHVVSLMKATQAVIGGEGNGGVIVPDLHYGRDALAGVALILSALATSQKTMSQLRSQYTDYYMSKEKVQLRNRDIIPKLLDELALSAVHDGDIDRQDGLKISWKSSWVQIRPSNTEPVLRIYSEAMSPHEAEKITQEYLSIINEKIEE